MNFFNNSFGKVSGRGISSNILGQVLAFDVDGSGRCSDDIAEEWQADSSEHVAGRDDLARWVGQVFTDQSMSGASSSRLKHHVVWSERSTGDNTSSTDKSSTERPHDGAVKVWHDQDIELTRVLDHLHAGVVDNHLFELDMRVLLGSLSADLEEQSVDHLPSINFRLHNVRLVNTRDLLSADECSVLECELADSFGLFAGHDLDRLEDSWVDLVLDTRVLALEVFSDDDHVDSFMSHVADVGQSAQVQHFSKKRVYC